MKAFSLVELVFVIVILGILAAVAIPRMGGIKDDAIDTAKGLGTVSAVRSGIATVRNQNIVTKGSATLGQLDSATIGTTGQKLFQDVLSAEPIISSTGAGGWMKDTNATSYLFYRSNGVAVRFDYFPSSGSFNCNHNDGNCTAILGQ